MQSARATLKRYNESVPPDQQVPLGGKGINLDFLTEKIAQLKLQPTEEKEPTTVPTVVIPFYGHFPKDGKYYQFSNWAKSPFKAHGRDFVSTEQYMMVRKAQLFKDNEKEKEMFAAADITLTDSAWHKAMGKVKQLGRQVANFDETTWANAREAIMEEGLFFKFSQNDDMKRVLLSTDDKILAEATTKDKIWSCGLNVNDPNVQDPTKWKGKNLLGKALMKVREMLKK